MPKPISPILVKAEDLHAGRMENDAEYREAYAALEDEFRQVNAQIEARGGSVLSLAERRSLPGHDGR